MLDFLHEHDVISAWVRKDEKGADQAPIISFCVPMNMEKVFYCHRKEQGGTYWTRAHVFILIITQKTFLLILPNLLQYRAPKYGMATSFNPFYV